MKPTVHLIKGLHLTGTDKRNILATIAYLEENFAAFIESSPQTVPNYGVMQSLPMTVTVRVKNRAALHLPNYAQPDNSPNLFTEGELSQ